jgi:hypothetical protein
MNQTLLIETLPVREVLLRESLLGLRFWDEVTGRVVRDGLVVTAYPAKSPLRRIEAVVNTSGIYVLNGLPGLKEVEFGIAQPSKATFKIEVIDAWRRFQPFLLTRDAPVEGIITSPDAAEASSPSTSPGISLYSTASRAVPAPMAVLRAELREWKSSGDHEGDPARWAVVEARMGGRRIARGVADERGVVALLFSYPAPVTHTFGSPPEISPPGAESSALRDQQWPIEVSASFDRLNPEPPLPKWPYPPFPRWPALPELSDVLSQSPATLWADTDRNEVLTEAMLSFGRELVVASVDRAVNKTRSVLFISAAGSPP